MFLTELQQKTPKIKMSINNSKMANIFRTLNRNEQNPKYNEKYCNVSHGGLPRFGVERTLTTNFSGKVANPQPRFGNRSLWDL